MRTETVDRGRGHGHEGKRRKTSGERGEVKRASEPNLSHSFQGGDTPAGHRRETQDVFGEQRQVCIIVRRTLVTVCIIATLVTALFGPYLLASYYVEMDDTGLQNLAACFSPEECEKLHGPSLMQLAGQRTILNGTIRLYDAASAEAILAECTEIPDRRAGRLTPLAKVLRLQGDVDEFGQTSSLVQPVSLVKKLVEDGRIGPGNRTLYAVNFGARDGIGSGGNTDPSYPLFAELGFHGLAVEADGQFVGPLRHNLRGLPVTVATSFITVDNAVALIQGAGLSSVDVFKIDIDSFDCDVLPRVLRAFGPAVVIAEYNVYFPPPIKMKLVPSRMGYDSNQRGNIYECSIQYLNDDVMRPLGYVLLQLDWQNVIYVREEIAEGLGMAGGVEVQAAYHQGYTTQPDRLKHIPWGTSLEPLQHAATHVQRMAAALKWAKTSTHKQPEGVIIGCGKHLVEFQFGSGSPPPAAQLGDTSPIMIQHSEAAGEGGGGKGAGDVSRTASSHQQDGFVPDIIMKSHAIPHMRPPTHTNTHVHTLAAPPPPPGKKGRWRFMENLRSGKSEGRARREVEDLELIVLRNVTRITGTIKDVETVREVLRECKVIADKRNATLSYLSQVLPVSGPAELDEFGAASRLLQPATVVRHLIAKGLIPLNGRQQLAGKDRVGQGGGHGGGKGRVESWERVGEGVYNFLLNDTESKSVGEVGDRRVKVVGRERESEKGAQGAEDKQTNVRWVRDTVGVTQGGVGGTQGARAAHDNQTHVRQVLYAVNFGARDGKGGGGNTDPSYALYAEQGFRGLAVEAAEEFQEHLARNLGPFNVTIKQSFITVGNAVALIQGAGLSSVDVFKIDIDSFDCDVLPRVLRAFGPAVVIAEYNVYFPPPIKMKLVPSRMGYDSNQRGNIYECSIQYLNDDVMRPLGYVLLQLDWQNVIYVREEIAEGLGMAGGVEVQAAYHQGYTTQPDRLKHIPWGTSLEPLQHAATHVQRMAAALKWAKTSTHKQHEGALLGCGNQLLHFQWTGAESRIPQ